MQFVVASPPCTARPGRIFPHTHDVLEERTDVPCILQNFYVDIRLSSLHPLCGNDDYLDQTAEPPKISREEYEQLADDEKWQDVTWPEDDDMQVDRPAPSEGPLDSDDDDDEETAEPPPEPDTKPGNVPQVRKSHKRRIREEAGKLWKTESDWESPLWDCRRRRSAKIDAIIQIVKHHSDQQAAPMLRVDDNCRRLLTSMTPAELARFDEVAAAKETRQSTLEPGSQALKLPLPKFAAQWTWPDPAIPQRPEPLLDAAPQQDEPVDSLENVDLADRRTWPDKGILYCAFPRSNPVIQRALEINKIKYLELNGSMGVNHRDEVIKEFNRPDGARWLILSAVGSTGLNLARANLMVLVVCQSAL
jgi:hypothetical protein